MFSQLIILFLIFKMILILLSPALTLHLHLLWILFSTSTKQYSAKTTTKFSMTIFTTLWTLAIPMRFKCMSAQFEAMFHAVLEVRNSLLSFFPSDCRSKWHIVTARTQCYSNIMPQQRTLRRWTSFFPARLDLFLLKRLMRQTSLYTLPSVLSQLALSLQSSNLASIVLMFRSTSFSLSVFAELVRYWYCFLTTRWVLYTQWIFPLLTSILRTMFGHNWPSEVVAVSIVTDTDCKPQLFL